MGAAKDSMSPHATHRAHAYAHMYEQYVVDAAFLWVLRAHRVNQPDCTLEDMATLEQRLEDQLDGLMASMDTGWTACEAALEGQEPGEVFTAAVIALRSHEIPKIQKAVQVGLSSERTSSALVSALGWLSPEIARPWIERLLNGKDMHHKYLGVAACSVRREDPGDILTAILKREDSRTHAGLYARALRLVGELRRQDLLPALIVAQSSDNEAVRFWAGWSAILLGNIVAVKHLQPYVFQPGPLQNKAIQLVFRVLPIDQAREWISTLSQDKNATRAVITATGVLGDPHAVNWLITKMADPLLARLAGEAFTNITGIELASPSLQRNPPPERALFPNDDPDDAQVSMDEDENLPWPDAEKVVALWRHHGSSFIAGQRYFLGQALTKEVLQHALTSAYQRQRHAAALELALIDPQARLINTHAKVIP